MAIMYMCGMISDTKSRQANIKQIPRRQDNGFIFTVKKELEKYQEKTVRSQDKWKSLKCTINRE